jgi:hypothetical protein
MARTRSGRYTVVVPALAAALLGGACGGGGEPTGPAADPWAGAAGTWVGSTDAHEVTLELRPTTWTGQCGFLGGTCTAPYLESWATYRDLKTGETFPRSFGQSERRAAIEPVRFDLGRRTVSPTEWNDYWFEGRLEGRTRIVGQLMTNFRRANTSSDAFAPVVAATIALVRR